MSVSFYVPRHDAKALDIVRREIDPVEFFKYENFGMAEPGLKTGVILFYTKYIPELQQSNSYLERYKRPKVKKILDDIENYLVSHSTLQPPSKRTIFELEIKIFDYNTFIAFNILRDSYFEISGHTKLPFVISKVER